MSDLCSCGLPVATCPHLGVFATIDEKHAYFRAIGEVHDGLGVLIARTDAKLALEAARVAAENAAKLPLGPEVAAAVGAILAALAKAALLAGLD